MGFVDNKDKILEIILTDYGRKLLSKGELVIKYYSFGDDEIDYEVLSGYSGSTGD